jgi:hypothetical protein
MELRFGAHISAPAADGEELRAAVFDLPPRLAC